LGARLPLIAGQLPNIVGQWISLALFRSLAHAPLGILKNPMKKLTDDEFAKVIRLAPVVSIDLIIRDSESNVLVALRSNEPAKGVYFVPGGCIRKERDRCPKRAAHG
jgi:hypothetical protein